MAKDGWSTDTEENLPADQQTPHSGVWEDEATCKAKYSRVREGDDVPIKENVNDMEADSLSETVVIESVSSDKMHHRASSVQIIFHRSNLSRRLQPRLTMWRKEQQGLLQGETSQRRTRGPLRHRL